MTTAGLELVTFACPACERRIDIEDVVDIRRFDWRTVALTCPCCDEWIHVDWPGDAGDPPAFARSLPIAREDGE